jgi:hypothetical protein
MAEMERLTLCSQCCSDRLRPVSYNSRAQRHDRPVHIYNETLDSVKTGSTTYDARKVLAENLGLKMICRLVS